MTTKPTPPRQGFALSRWLRQMLRAAQITAVVLVATTATVSAQTAGKKPNILVLWGDDIGIANVSAYSDGVMGYETPNIDRLAKEGLRFLHYYGEQSCTAGRAALKRTAAPAGRTSRFAG